MAENRKKFIADIYPGDQYPIDDELGSALFKFQSLFPEHPIWLILQSRSPEEGTEEHYYSEINASTYLGLLEKDLELAEDTSKIAIIIIDSPGGNARIAYRIAQFFNRRSGFIAVIPRMAKSAATLLALGAQEIWMGIDAELGPLDTQITENGKSFSALDEFQALGELNNQALAFFGNTMWTLQEATRKNREFILPHVIDYVNGLFQPIVGGIDPVHFTQMSRLLSEVQDYAIRLLLRGSHDYNEANRIANELVTKFSQHEFVIDSSEALTMGLNVKSLLSKEHKTFVNELIPILNKGITSIGQFKQIK